MEPREAGDTGYYLDAFLTASSRINERIYVDAFAGAGEGVDRLTGEKFEGSARIAMEASGTAGHRFTRLLFFETRAVARSLEKELQTDFPMRDFKVYAGDCNEQIPRALADLRALRWAPTFAFLDPNGLELAWTTIEALARHKRGYRGSRSDKPEYKVEMWILFSSQGLIRTLALDRAKLRPKDDARATRLFGTDAWRGIYERRLNDALDPADAKAEYVNLMRWRLVHDLAYTRAHALELKNLNGGTVYHMIFATDNPAGDRIMTSLYARAAERISEMRREALDRRRQQLAFELPGGGDETNPPYEYEPPWRPEL